MCTDIFASINEYLCELARQQETGLDKFLQMGIEALKNSEFDFAEAFIKDAQYRSSVVAAISVLKKEWSELGDLEELFNQEFPRNKVTVFANSNCRSKRLSAQIDALMKALTDIGVRELDSLNFEKAQLICRSARRLSKFQNKIAEVFPETGVNRKGESEVSGFAA